MKPLAGLIAALLMVAACATPVPTSSPTSTVTVSPTVVPTPAPTPEPSPQVSCGDFPPGDCQAAVVVILTQNEELQVAGAYRTATRIELGRGIYCPNGPAFETTSCPAGGFPPASGGVWIGHALVTFAGTSYQAFVDVSKNGQTIHAMFTGVASPPPSTPASS